MKKYVIIVAGGKGLRMGSDLPKQFLPMGDKPVLMHTLEVFRKYDETLQIIVVLPQEQQDFWKQLCQKHSFVVEHILADGGETRFHSVKNGLALVQGPGLVGVHDGVRPFVSVWGWATSTSRTICVLRKQSTRLAMACTRWICT